MPTLIEIAKAEIGYTETGNNDTKYGDWYELNNQAWCAMFVSWCFDKAGLGGKVRSQSKKGFASCAHGLKFFAENNKLIPVGQARAGDIAFFQFDKDAEPDHVGIIKYNNTALKYLQVIEGNTSADKSGSQSNGDGVYLKRRSYSLVMAVARP